jgi:hypothetical protein
MKRFIIIIGGIFKFFVSKGAAAAAKGETGRCVRLFMMWVRAHRA